MFHVLSCVAEVVFVLIMQLVSDNDTILGHFVCAGTHFTDTIGINILCNFLILILNEYDPPCLLQCHADVLKSFVHRCTYIIHVYSQA